MTLLQARSQDLGQLAADAERTQSAAPRQRVRLSPTAATFDPCLPFDAWEEIGKKVGTHASASGWWLGDWLAFGRFKYGRRYRCAIAATGLDYQTLRNYAVVARRFEHSRRRADLSFQHHAEVCGLPNEAQDRLLGLAVSLGWSRNELRREVRAMRVAPAPVARIDVLELPADVERTDRWRRAAGRAGCTVEEWAVRMLDDAAADETAPIPIDAR